MLCSTCTHQRKGLFSPPLHAVSSTAHQDQALKQLVQDLTSFWHVIMKTKALIVFFFHPTMCRPHQDPYIALIFTSQQTVLHVKPQPCHAAENKHLEAHLLRTCSYASSRPTCLGCNYTKPRYVQAETSTSVEYGTKRRLRIHKYMDICLAGQTMDLSRMMH